MESLEVKQMGGTLEIKNVMTLTHKCCQPTDCLADAARVMWENDLGALPVVDQEGKPVAMVTDRDIAMGAYLSGERLAAVTVAQVMSKSVTTCIPSTSLTDAEGMMQAAEVRRLPVVDHEGKLVGVVTLSDIARAIDAGLKHRDGSDLRDGLVRTVAVLTCPRTLSNGHTRGMQLRT